METEDPIELLLENTPCWGKHQLLAYLSLGFICCFAVFPMSYIFTARDVKYRCMIEECEGGNISETPYNPEWLRDFVPFKDDSPDSCHRYALMNNSCSKQDVVRNDTIRCKKFIYQTKDYTILQDFDLYCDENVWMLTLVGTINVVGEMVCLTYSGFLSDKYGRKRFLILNIMLSTMAGILKSFSVSYVMYLTLEFIDPALGGGMYNGAFILAMEYLTPNQRNLANVILCSMYSLGEIILGIVAWLAPSWRSMLRILYIPGLISFTFYWTIPESIRWLLSKKKEREIKKILTHFTGEREHKILSTLLQEYNKKPPNAEIMKHEKTEKFSDAIKSRVLVLRLIHCSFTWMSCGFVFYGLTMHSVAISENIYLSFICSTAVEIPGYIIYYYGNGKIGRRWMMFVSFLMTGVACLAVGFIQKAGEIPGYIIYYYGNEKNGQRLMIFLSFISTGVICLAVGFIQKDLEWLRLTLFLIGKCGSTTCYTLLYVFTTEMFPTSSRHAMFSVCAVMGRLGAMVAPQLPLLSRVSEILPLLMFAIIACTSGTLALLFPETLNTKLPDTIQEAINIDKKRNQGTGSHKDDRDG